MVLFKFQNGGSLNHATFDAALGRLVNGEWGLLANHVFLVLQDTTVIRQSHLFVLGAGKRHSRSLLFQ
jgi:hypothetical protein